MRSSAIRWPPASAMAHAIAMPASRAWAMAVVIICLAPAWVRRLLSATYMALRPGRRLVGGEVCTMGPAPASAGARARYLSLGYHSDNPIDRKFQSWDKQGGGRQPASRSLMLERIRA